MPALPVSISNIAKALDELQAQESRLRWALYTTGLDFGVEASSRRIVEFKKDPANFRIIRDMRERQLSPRNRRAVEILYRDFRDFHQSDKASRIHLEIENLETSLSDLLNKNRPVLDGREVASLEISKILSESPDRAFRQKAYEAQIPTNRRLVDAGFIKLLDLRKEYALACGANDFVSFRLEKDELSASLFEGARNQCEIRRARFKAARQSLARRHLSEDDLMPWDSGYLKTIVCKYNRSEVDMTNYFQPIEKTFAKFGFDIRKINLTFDIFPRKNKSEWGYAFPIECGRDSRILANVDKHFSSFWVLLHETAHGVHFLGLDPGEILLNMGISGIVAEGFANFFGNLSFSREFLSEVFPARDVDAIHAAFTELRKIENLDVFPTLAMSLFDQALYSREIDSLDDICSLYWSIEKDLLGQEPYSCEPAWGRIIHHTIAPVYLHNYYLGDVLGDGMKRAFQGSTGNDPDHSSLEFGLFWKDKILKPSGELPFEELYRRVLGEEPSVSIYLDRCLEPFAPI